MGSSSIISKRYAFRCDPGRIVQVKIAGQTVLALHDQETVRNNGQTSYSRLNTSVKLRIDQMMRTRNFRVRNEVVERGSVTTSQKGKKAIAERKVGDCFRWKAQGQCSKGDSCSFRHDRQAQGYLCSVSDEKDDGLLPHQIRRPRPTKGEKNPHTQAERKALQTRGAKFRAVTKNVKNPSCRFWHPPMSQN